MTTSEGFEMVWIVTKKHNDDREVVKGVYRYANSAYSHAAHLTSGADDVESQTVSVMAHEVKTAREVGDT